jgi:hypothetical protein
MLQLGCLHPAEAKDFSVNCKLDVYQHVANHVCCILLHPAAEPTPSMLW